MELDIRAAVEADTPLILAFTRELADYEKLLHEVRSTEQRLRELLFGEHPAAEVLIAEWSGEPVGFALFFHNFSTFEGKRGIYLEDLFVRPTHRGKGIGKRLLAELARIAVARDCARLEWAVLDWNEPAIRFYRSLGARQVREWIVNRVSGDALRDLAAG